MREHTGVSSKREQFVKTALELFTKNGIHTTGTNTIEEQSGVTRTTLYAHFCSKEELILAVLRHYDGVVRNDFIRRVEKSGKTPRARLLAIFDVAHQWRHQKNVYGCLFINTIGEFSDKDRAIRQASECFIFLVWSAIILRMTT